jgi:hypothetical protein
MEQPKHLFRIALFALSKNEAEFIENGKKVKRRTVKYETGIATDIELAKDLARDYWKRYPDTIWNKEVRIVNDAAQLVYQYPHVQPLPQTRKDTPKGEEAPEKNTPKSQTGTHKAQKQKAGKAGKGV